MPSGIYDRGKSKNLPDPNVLLSEPERAYLAGIIDGEGSILLIHHRAIPGVHKYEYWTLRVSIVNTDKRLTDWLLARFGGWYTIAISKRATHRDVFQWRLDSVRAKRILLTAMPYLILKQAQAKLALEYIETHKLVGCRGHSQDTIDTRRRIAGQIKALNRRGKTDTPMVVGIP